MDTIVLQNKHSEFNLRHDVIKVTGTTGKYTIEQENQGGDSGLAKYIWQSLA